MENRYTRSQISQKLNLKIITVNKRFSSKYAEKRWGIESEKRRDGSIIKFVPESKIHLWVENIDYTGRPVFEK